MRAGSRCRCPKVSSVRAAKRPTRKAGSAVPTVVSVRPSRSVRRRLDAFSIARSRSSKSAPESVVKTTGGSHLHNARRARNKEANGAAAGSVTAEVLSRHNSGSVRKGSVSVRNSNNSSRNNNSSSNGNKGRRQPHRRLLAKPPRGHRSAGGVADGAGLRRQHKAALRRRRHSHSNSTRRVHRPNLGRRGRKMPRKAPRLVAIASGGGFAGVVAVEAAERVAEVARRHRHRPASDPTASLQAQPIRPAPRRADDSP